MPARVNIVNRVVGFTNNSGKGRTGIVKSYNHNAKMATVFVPKTGRTNRIHVNRINSIRANRRA
jgi:hypothetical protein